MGNNKKKYFILISALVLLILVTGVAYAYFNYHGEETVGELIAGDIYLNLTEGNDSINLTNVFPESIEEARSRNDNTLTFNVTGKNEFDKDIYYEILLNNGSEYTGRDRFLSRDIVFDLVEIDEEDNETYLLDAVSFENFDGQKIWIDKIAAGTNSNITRTYQLRMWLSSYVTFGEGTGVSYTSEEFANRYASIKVGVSGDLNEKSLPATSITRSSYVENGVSYFMTKLSNNYLLEEAGALLENNDAIKLEITNPENKVYFEYRDSKGNENFANQESLTLNYVYNRNEIVNIQVFTQSRNNSNVSTYLKFKVTKNGTVVEEYIKYIDVIGNNYCLSNGFNNLHDCILVTENLSRNTSSAISYINSKGEPDVNTTAPTYEYIEQVTENEAYQYAGATSWSMGAKYVFNPAMGTFALMQDDGTTPASTYVALSNDLIGKYTCGVSGRGYTACDIIYRVTGVDVENDSITGTKITYKVNGSLDSQVGLYKVVDNSGDSYIFRGNVKNNNVYFGGYYWKIIRINGDGTIRMIFNGNSLLADGNNTAGNDAVISSTELSGVGSKYAFNILTGGPTYAGYMVTESTNYWITTTTTSYTGFNQNYEYYFADDFELYTDSSGNRQFKLKKNNYLVKVKLKDLTAGQLNAPLYTCARQSSNLICDRLLKISSRSSNTSVEAYYITYSPNYEDNSSLTKADVELNERDSTAKRQLDLWYRDKFMSNENNGKSVTTYLADEVFCNDRSTSSVYTHDDYNLSNSNAMSGYLLTRSTNYNGNRRLITAVDGHKSATLLCNSEYDRFSVSNAHAQLTYPVGLITADEVALAGGKYNIKNENYYLRIAENFWTMTPSHYSGPTIYMRLNYVQVDGRLYNYQVSNEYGLRAVINLKANTLINDGDGTATSPYIID